MLESLSENWPLKLLALAAAFTVWATIMGQRPLPQDFPVPLEVRVSEGLTLSESPPNTVTVRLRGKQTILRRIDALSLSVNLDLRGKAPGQHEEPLSRVHLTGVPSGAEVDFFDPRSVRVTIEPALQRDVPVLVEFLGEPAEGFFRYHSRVVPELVRISGPESEVNSLDVVRTEAILLDGRDRPFTARVRPIPDRPHVETLAPQTLEVRVLIDRNPAARRFTEIPVVAAGAAQAVVEPASIEVRLTGSPNLLDRLKPEQIRAIADVTELEPRERVHRVPVRVDLVELSAEQQWRITDREVSPSQVSVRLLPTQRSG